MQISQLIDHLPAVDLRGSGTVEVAGLAYHSGGVLPGSLFFCLPGEHTDGHAHAEEAVAKGAGALVVTRWLPIDVVQVKVESAREAMGVIAGRFYGDPSSELAVVGITGTNGKTTTTYLVEHILGQVGKHVGVIGTISARLSEHSYTSERTTPESADLLSILRDMADRGADAVVMEVSSHAIEMDRHLGTRFDVLTFTNLSQDHLDYHMTMDNYRRAKERLFEDERVHKPGWAAACNLDDRAGRRIARFADGRPLHFSVHNDSPVRAVGLNADRSGTAFILAWGEEEVAVTLPLLGGYNVSNALAAAATCVALEIPLAQIGAALSRAPQVPGRMELVGPGTPFRVFVDYAHTPDALKQALQAARQATSGRVIVVFGCGGDRDREKRPQMGGVAAELADTVFVTSDNPRSEDPQAIINAVLEGVSGSTAVTSLVDRRAAITEAVSAAGPGDVVLIAGKGHESGQTLADRTIPFDDRLVATEVFNERCSPSPQPS